MRGWLIVDTQDMLRHASKFTTIKHKDKDVISFKNSGELKVVGKDNMELVGLLVVSRVGLIDARRIHFLFSFTIISYAIENTNLNSNTRTNHFT